MRSPEAPEHLRMHDCGPFKGRVTMASCAANRAKPLVTDPLRPGVSEREASLRPPACTEQCPDYLRAATEGLDAWSLVKKRCNVDTQYDLADMIDTHQTKISQMFMKLRKGLLPDGPEWDALLKASGLTPAVLLAAAKNPFSYPVRGCAAKQMAKGTAPAPAPHPMMSMQEGATVAEARSALERAQARNEADEQALRHDPLPGVPWNIAPAETLRTADVPALLAELARRVPGATITITVQAAAAA